LIVTHVIEYKVLELGAEVGGVANRRCLKVSLGLLRDVPDVAAIALLSYRITDVAKLVSFALWHSTRWDGVVKLGR
jgi:hypothetical protein